MILYIESWQDSRYNKFEINDLYFDITEKNINRLILHRR
jgi:hypothetical protein